MLVLYGHLSPIFVDYLCRRGYEHGYEGLYYYRKDIVSYRIVWYIMYKDMESVIL